MHPRRRIIAQMSGLASGAACYRFRAMRSRDSYFVGPSGSRPLSCSRGPRVAGDKPRLSSGKRGVILLVALLMLSLFMLLGTSYILVANRRRPCSSVGGVIGSKVEVAAGETAGKAKKEILGGQPDGSNQGTVGKTATDRARKFLASSLFADKYGDLYEQVSLSTIAPLTLAGNASPAIPFYTIEVAGVPTYGPDATFKNWQKAGKSPDLGSHVGRILAIESDGEPNGVFRIVAQKGSRYLAHLVNPTAAFDHRNLTAGAVVSIQGREFSGDGSVFELHETYDAADSRNFFMAWVQTDAVLGRDQLPGTGDEPASAESHRYVIPSFHRPDQLLEILKSNPGSAYGSWLADPISLLRPAGKMTWNVPATEWSQYGLSGPPALPTGNALEHPNFTGGNVRTTGGATQYFDPLHGPWDVDNDEDGITDSIWLDVGMSPVTMGNAQVQPLVAIMILDLDGRVNLNAHGTHRDLARSPAHKNPTFIKDEDDVMWIYTSYRYAGTVPSKLLVTIPVASSTAAPDQAVVPTAQGWGVADIHPGRVFLGASSSALMKSLLQGAVSTGSSSPIARIPYSSIKAEGRFGDSAAGSDAMAPAPGALARNDPGIDAPGAQPRDAAVPDTYGAGKAFRSPVDPQGRMTVALDQMGQPYFDRLYESGVRRPWSSDQIDDPYDVSLGRQAPRPGWSFDPDVFTTPSTLQDNLFAAPQFERLLRVFEPAAEKLSPRLVSLLGDNAETARVTTTIESWDTPAVTIPRSRLEPLLGLSDQADSSRPSLVSWDLQFGLRMDVNRPFGDGLDNNNDGIVDEPGEYSNEIAADVYGTKGSAFEQQCLTNGRDVDGDSDCDLVDQQSARELFARHLYVAARQMAPDLPAKDAAQWAVNVVDMRDPDSIITRFAFDANSPQSKLWDPKSADNKDNVVWGCERPDLLITEAMAWRNIKVEPGPIPPASEYSDKGTGGLVIELYCPWTGVTTAASALSSAIPGELLAASSGTKAFSRDSKIDLAKLNPQNEPVFQIVAVREEAGGATSTNLEKDPTWPPVAGGASGTISGLVIYPAKAGGTAVPPKGSLGTFVSGAGPNVDVTTVSTGQFALVSGPIASGTGAALVNTVDLQSGTAAMEFNYSTFSDAKTQQVLQVTGGLTETITGSFGFQPNDRSSGKRYPDFPTAGPVGGLVCVENPDAATLPLRFPTKAETTPDLTYMAEEKYRLLLRRLANPLAAHDPKLNPYICIDSLVVQDQAVAPGSSLPGAGGTLKSAERCAAQPADHTVNNLWAHAAADDDANIDIATVAPVLGTVTEVNASLGFLPARLKIPSGADTAVEAEQPAFPWLTWLNRDFVSEHELLLVPKSSPATLLRDHTHEWPFKHLFFQLGSGTTPALKELEQNKAGILELLRVPSRFADAESRLPPADVIAVSTALAGLGGKPLFLPPHNYLSHFREPGRVNLNTMSSSAVWAAMNNGLPGAPYEDEVTYDDKGTPVLPFKTSEDWSLVSGSASSPRSGNYTLDNGEDANADSQLDVNHDENNDGTQQLSKLGMLRSISASRRGWPLADDGSTPAILGQFDRVLNRKGVTTARRWFSKPFQSGWPSDSNMAYVADESLMLRSWAGTTAASGSSSTFEFGFKHINDANADKYLIDKTGMKKWAESGSPSTTYWGPSANGLESRLIYRFDFDAPATAIDLRANSPTWDFGGGHRGASSLEVSKDGTNWISLRNNLEPRKWGEGWEINDKLPAEVTGGTSLFVRMRFYTENSGGSFTVAQFGRSTSAATMNVFQVNATLGTSAEAGPTYLMATNYGLKDSKGKDQDGRPYADPRRNPFFRYREMMRLSNLTTPRSNVFAVWMTVGFFVIEPHPDPNVGGTALGAEYGLDTSTNERFKTFLIIDRSIPVGYRQGTPLNSQDAVLLEHFGN